MNTRARRTLLGLAAGVLLVSGTGSLAAADGGQSKLDRLRFATAPYFDIDEAVEDGYGELQDAEGIACIDAPDGGMGIHYVNGARVGDGRIRLLRPEAVIYEPQADGDMDLVAVEYVVLRSAWREDHPTGRPRLMGHRFELVKAGNRYDLPAFFELHVWAWRANENGRFEDWNPDVTCEFAPSPS